MPTTPLFAPDLPDGFQYREEFITGADEQRLVQEIGGLTFSNFELHGVIAKRRSTASSPAFGCSPPVV